MWWLYMIFAVVSSGKLMVFAQDAQGSSSSEVDGFVFDGPVNRPPSNDPVTSNVRGSTATSTTRTISTTTTTASSSVNAEYDVCVTTCPATPEFNPVCGSDNVDYDNPGRLSCAAACGKDVTLKYYGRCMTTKIRGG